MSKKLGYDAGYKEGWNVGYESGYQEGYEAGSECCNTAYESGQGAGRGMAEYKIANEMRVLFCALITAHKREDSKAFWATVEIAKTIVEKYALFDEGDWAVFRGDTPATSRRTDNGKATP